MEPRLAWDCPDCGDGFEGPATFFGRLELEAFKEQHSHHDKKEKD